MTMDDTISRQAAIEAVESLIVKGYDLRTMDRNTGICKARDELLKLPSEQPGCLDEDGTLCTVVANPYEVKKVLVVPDGFSDYLSVSFYPDARKTGKWIKKMRVTETEKYISYDPDWYCSCCEAKYDPCIAKIVNFCYVCGADMRGEQDE